MVYVGKGKDTGTSLRELLAAYDRRVADAFGDVTAAGTGTARVRALHVLQRVVAAHDSVVGATLCPLLRELPGGTEVAERLRHGCEERAASWKRFQELTQGTAAHNVYPVFGVEIEAILVELQRSFDQHVEHETTRVGEVLEAAAGSVEPEVVAASMAIEARTAPARPHRSLYRHPTSRTLRAFHRSIDRVRDWNDSHHGWPSTRHEAARPVRPSRTFSRRAPSVPDLLSGYDETVARFIAEFRQAGPTGTNDTARAAAAYRLAAAIAVHDSIVEGTLCRLLDAVPEGRPAAATLERGCQKRGQLLERWAELTKHETPANLFTHPGREAESILEELIASFESHEDHETREVSAVVEALRARSWSSGGTGLVSPYLLPDWPNPEPAVLAAHMALWGEKAPTRTHQLLRRHPANRLLRNFYRHADQLQDWRRSRHGWPTVV